MSDYNINKICIYSQMSPHQIADKFDFLDGKFQRVSQEEMAQANFIIYDLDEPDFKILEKETQYIYQHRIRCDKYSCMPVILVSFSELHPESKSWLEKLNILNKIRPPICRNTQELIDFLNWLDFMFHPAHIEFMQSVIKTQALHRMRESDI